MAAACAIAFGAFLWLVREQITSPARTLEHDLTRLAQGDFSAPIVSSTRDEIGRIASSAEALRSDLGQLIRGVAETICTVDKAASQMAAELGSVASAAARQSEGRDLHGKRRRAGDDVDPVDQQQQRTRLHTHPRQPGPISRGAHGSQHRPDRSMKRIA